MSAALLALAGQHDIAGEILALRERTGLQLRQLAALVYGVTPRAVGKWQSGEGMVPRYAAVRLVQIDTAFQPLNSRPCEEGRGLAAYAWIAGGEEYVRMLDHVAQCPSCLGRVADALCSLQAEE